MQANHVIEKLGYWQKRLRKKSQEHSGRISFQLAFPCKMYPAPNPPKNDLAFSALGKCVVMSGEAPCVMVSLWAKGGGEGKAGGGGGEDRERGQPAALWGDTGPSACHRWLGPGLDGKDDGRGLPHWPHPQSFYISSISMHCICISISITTKLKCGVR